MTNQEIFDLMDRFERSSLQSMKLSKEGFSLELNRASAAAPSAAVIPAAAPAPSSAPAPAAPAARPADGPVIAAPLVGTYYATPAPCDCVIEEVLKASGELVAFEEPLFRYRAV